MATAKTTTEAPADTGESPPPAPTQTIYFNGDVIDEPLVNSHVVGVDYEAPAPPDPEADG
jgi:hypothetical protein